VTSPRRVKSGQDKMMRIWDELAMETKVGTKMETEIGDGKGMLPVVFRHCRRRTRRLLTRRDSNCVFGKCQAAHRYQEL
jgi:hypothetical protein